jgi:hypothetical protein
MWITILVWMAGIVLTDGSAWGADDPMPECTKRLSPIQERMQEQKKMIEQLQTQIDGTAGKEPEKASEKGPQEGQHDYRTRLIKSWMKIEADYDRLELQFKDLHTALENVAFWAAENQMLECIKPVRDEQQVIQKIERQMDEMIDKTRDTFIQRLEESKQLKPVPPQQTQPGADWVLWTHSSSLSYSTGTKESWNTVASFGTKNNCIEESKKKLKETEKDGFKWQSGYSTAFKEDKEGTVLTVQYVCLQNTEDPREEKGKGKK